MYTYLGVSGGAGYTFIREKVMNWELIQRVAREASVKYSRRLSLHSPHTPEDLLMEIITRAAAKAEQPAFSRALRQENMAVLKVAMANIALDIIREWNSEASIPESGVEWVLDDVRAALHTQEPRYDEIRTAYDALSQRAQKVLMLATLSNDRSYAYAVLRVTPSTFRKLLSRALTSLNQQRQSKARFQSIYRDNGGE